MNGQTLMEENGPPRADEIQNIEPEMVEALKRIRAIPTRKGIVLMDEDGKNLGLATRSKLRKLGLMKPTDNGDLARFKPKTARV